MKIDRNKLKKCTTEVVCFFLSLYLSINDESSVQILITMIKLVNINVLNLMYFFCVQLSHTMCSNCSIHIL